jgi:hypothetical protein
MSEHKDNKNKNTNYLAWGAAFLGGAMAAIFLSPWTGKKARSWLSQKSSHLSSLSDKAMEKTQTKFRYGAGITEGWLHKARTFINPSEKADLDDTMLAQRVQTALGENPLTWDLPRLNVNSENFVITVRGPINSVEQLHDVENVIRNVKGVRRVINDLRISA